MWIVSHPEMAVREVNDAACHLLKRDRKEILGKVIGKTFHRDPKGIKRLMNTSTTEFADGGLLITESGNKESLAIRLRGRPIDYKNEKHCLIVGEDASPSLLIEKSAHDFHRAIVSSSIVSRANTQGVITYVNKNFEEVSGYRKEELIGQNHRIINSGHHGPEFWKGMWKTIAAGKIWREEVRNKAKDGSYYWVDTFIMPFLDANERITEFLSIRNDITRRKSQEEEIKNLNHSLCDFKNAISGSSIVSRADRTGVITDVNENFVSISGYAKDELIGENHRKINSGYHPRSFWIEMWKTIARGDSWRAEVKNRSKDGSFYWVDTFVFPLKDKDGEVVEYLSIRNDITQRKLQEELLLQNEIQFRRLTRRLNLALNVSGLGVWQVDLKTRKLVGNDRACEIYGVKNDSLTFDELWSMVHPEDRERKMMSDELQFQNGGTDFTSEHRIIRPVDGEIRYIRSRGIFFPNEQGVMSEGITVCDDHTVERNYEAGLLDSLKEKDMLVKEIHHRVKNNLQLLSSMFYIRTLKTNDDFQKEFIYAMREKIRTISLVHEKLLQTNYINSIDIRVYIEQLVNDIVSTYHSSKLSLGVNLQIEQHLFSTDVTMYLGQLINELVLNAIKHAFVGRSRGTIEVRLNQINNQFLLVVQDDGVGVKDEMNPILSGSYGMQLINVFVSQLKGMIEVVRQNGTRFEIRFSTKQ